MTNARSTSTARRILIVDDHELLRDGLKVLLANQSGLVVYGEAAGDEDAMRLVDRDSTGNRRRRYSELID